MGFLLFLTVFLTDSAEKQIGQSRMAVQNKLGVSVGTPCVWIFLDGNGFRPCFITGGNPPVPVFLLDGICEDIQCPVQSESLHYLCRCLTVQRVSIVMLPDRRFNSFFAGGVGSVGCPVLLQLPMLLGVACRERVHWRFSECAALFFQNHICPGWQL